MSTEREDLAKLLFHQHATDRCAEAKLAKAATQRDEFEAEKDGAWAEVRRLTAERDFRRDENRELAPTLERVRALTECGAHTLTRETIRAALTPPKPFELPSAVPARIVAVKRSTGDEKELTLFTDGDTTWWADIDDWGPFWTRSQVMEQFTDHRLLGGAS